METKLDSVNKENTERQNYITKLEAEIEKLKAHSSQNGEDSAAEQKIKDLEHKLIRLAKEDEDKDKQILSLNKELKETKHQRDSQMTDGQTSGKQNQPSKSCVIL
ncbi:hypothetical protein FSP39_019913 [Pinctada imbricata]|uniref:Uncharacterized protein n=1 Tax=Pinctada imbricata TaxID=66713 RepID=A0AA89CBA7_PINIB|nr:hypothetical protein FSP39_019913 [Pinctada imbricata]